MILAGDEALRTQRGNNNAWCQDNPLGWFDWTLVEKNADMVRFVSELVALRKRHPSLRRRRFLSGRARNGARIPDIAWYGEDGGPPDWDSPDCRCLAFTLAAIEEDELDLHIVLNFEEDARTFVVPRSAERVWQLVLDTSRGEPGGGVPPAGPRALTRSKIRLAPRSLVVLEGR
jgi:glycogen operon protein